MLAKIEGEQTVSLEARQQSSTQEETNTLQLWLKRLIPALAILAWLAVIAVILWALGQISSAVVLLLLGATIATVLSTLVQRLQRVMPRPLAIGLVYLVVFCGIGTLLYFIINLIVDQLDSLIHYVQALITSNGNGQLQPIQQTLQQFGVSPDQLRAFGQQIVGQLQGIVGRIIPFISNIFSLLLNVVLVALLSVYFLLAGPRVTSWLRHQTPLRYRGTMNFLLDTLARIIGGNFRGVLLLATIISTLTGLGLYLLGIPYAFLLSVIAFVMEFIPIIGFYITAIAMVLVALTQGWVPALLALGLALAIQFLEGEVLSPRILGKSVGVNPIIAIAALVAGSQLYGILGAFFATPVAGLIQAILVAYWQHWKENHPDQFPQQKPKEG